MKLQEILENFNYTLYCDGILIRDINDIGSLKITNYGKQYLNEQDKFDIY